jgi:hypothetical protein
LIGQLNWADTLLYEHFNKSLFNKIARETDFYEEVAEFKAQVKVGTVGRALGFCRV